MVEACKKVGEYYEAVLDRTAFFPEGGGQYADTGIIDGVKVLDVQERNGLIFHTMESALPVGKSVEGTIDWEERFSKMQQHSGEHIVSGIIHSMFGYDNVGFHMGQDAITMDFNGLITKEQLREVEYRANQAVVANLDVQVMYPSKEELEHIYYRSKIEIEGQVRLVTVPGHDACACCAPHVKKTGEIGCIKLLGLQNYKGGVRISMLCGFRALEDYNAKAECTKALSIMLSAPEEDLVSEVGRQKEEIAQCKIEIAKLEQQLLVSKANVIEKGQELVVLFENDLSGVGPRELVNLLLERNTRVGAVFAGNDMEGYRYVIGSKEVDVRPFATMLSKQFGARGGGKPEMVQGSMKASKNEIKEAMEGCKNE